MACAAEVAVLRRESDTPLSVLVFCSAALVGLAAFGMLATSPTAVGLEAAVVGNADGAAGTNAVAVVLDVDAGVGVGVASKGAPSTAA